jgi:hypothetical protein
MKAAVHHTAYLLVMAAKIQKIVIFMLPQSDEGASDTNIIIIAQFRIEFKRKCKKYCVF